MQHLLLYMGRAQAHKSSSFRPANDLQVLLFTFLPYLISSYTPQCSFGSVGPPKRAASLAQSALAFFE